jgi:hypothetical protein
LEKLYEMDPGKLLKLANKESSGLVIYEESVTVEPGR